VRGYVAAVHQQYPAMGSELSEFHVLQHANQAIDEVRRAEFFRKGGRMRGVAKGKR
jgi:transposase